MTEDEAKDTLREELGAARFTLLEQFAGLLSVASHEQNLIARSTLPALWTRHILDSVQLLRFAPDTGQGMWVDIGSGAGLPGLVVAAASSWRVTLVEPRKLRVAFIKQCIDRLGLRSRVQVVPSRVETTEIGEPAAIISARAVAAALAVFAAASHLATLDTLWLLPKGRSASSEVATARQMWQGMFHVEQSIVDPQSGIIVAHQVRRR